MRTESLTVNVPPGLGDGARIRVPGKGHAGRNGGQHGDLYVTARVEPHPLFRREGDDLHVVVPIAVHEAALGAEDRGARTRGACAGARAGRHAVGTTVQAPRARRAVRASGRRGDLVVEVRLVLPRVLDERSKELLREFGRINGGRRENDVRKQS